MSATTAHICWDADKVGFLCPACQALRDEAQRAFETLELPEFTQWQMARG